MNKIFFSIIFLLFVSFQISFAQKKNATGGIVNGKATYLPKPDYPQEAKDFCAEGKVAVQILMDEKGDVISAETISGDELLREAAVDAAKKAKFSMEHFVVKTKGVLIYNFAPENKCVDGGVVNEKALKLPKPQIKNLISSGHFKLEYPTNIRVQIIIDVTTGEVIKARVLNGHPLIRPYLLKSALEAKFRSSFDSDGITVRGIIIYEVNPDGEINTDIKNAKTITIGHLAPETKPIFLPQPNYPAAAKLLKISGKIAVEILIDENGNVECAKAVSGHPLLRVAAETAAKQAIFPPQTLSETPVKAKSVIVYKFNPD